MESLIHILVCGGRHYNNFARICEVLSQKIITKIIHGGATGADLLAHKFAFENKIPTATYPALWFLHGKSAGFIRNQQMLDEGKPDLVIAFPGGNGTADMIRRAKLANIPVEIVC